MVDGRAAVLKAVKSPYIRNCLTDFGKIFIQIG